MFICLFFWSRNSAFWNLRKKMLHFSYGDCDTFMLRKNIFLQWWLFHGAWPPSTSMGCRARGQSPGGRRADVGEEVHAGLTQVTVPVVRRGWIVIIVIRSSERTALESPLGCPGLCLSWVLHSWYRGVLLRSVCTPILLRGPPCLPLKEALCHWLDYFPPLPLQLPEIL